MVMFSFSLGPFAILDDLDDCSSDANTYVERRISSASKSHGRSASKKSKSRAETRQTTTAHTRSHTREPTNKRSDATLKGAETALSTTVANLNVRNVDTKRKMRDTTTNVSTRHSVTNDTTARRSTYTAPAALGRGSSHRSRHEIQKPEDEGESRRQASTQEEVVQVKKKDDTVPEVQTATKETARSTITASQTKSREPSQAPPVSETETKPDVSAEELRKENRALHRRNERLEKDLAAYRRHIDHYRERRREAERERLKAEERVRELETVVKNMRESYDLEIDDLHTQITEYAAKAAATTSAAQLFTKDLHLTGQTEVAREATPVHEAGPSVHAPSQRSKAPSLHDFSVQTDPVLTQMPPRPTNPCPGDISSTVEDPPGLSAFLVQLGQKDAELRALKVFHEETPQISLADLSSSVRVLNTELRSLATAISTSVPLGRTWEAGQAWALEAAEPALARCLRLLAGVTGADFAVDTTLVRLALQAWIVSCLQRVFEKFLFGLEDGEDETLKRIFKRVQTRESPPVAARWRALTRRHARTLATPPIRTSAPSSGFSAAQDHAVHLLEMDVLGGAESILRFAGAHNPPGALLGELSTTHGRRISRLVRRAVRLARDLAERTPTGCEVFIVGGGDGEHGQQDDTDGVLLCGCMESVDQECRQWVGHMHKEDGGGRGRTAGTRTRTHTRAGTVVTNTARNKSKARSHRTATTRTWADTNIRQWDRDDSDEDDEEEEESEEEEAEEEEEEDVFVEEVDAHAGWTGHESVMCSLGFGLRRVSRRPRRKSAADARAEHRNPRAKRSEETLQREKRRGFKAEVRTLHGTESDSRSTFTLTSPASTRTEQQRTRQREEHTSHGLDNEDEVEERGEVDVLVKTDVLMSSTVDLLRKRIIL